MYGGKEGSHLVFCGLDEPKHMETGAEKFDLDLSRCATSCSLLHGDLEESRRVVWRGISPTPVSRPERLLESDLRHWE